MKKKLLYNYCRMEENSKTRDSVKTNQTKKQNKTKQQQQQENPM